MRIKTETIVGIFLITAILLFLFMAFFIGFFSFEKSHYNTYHIQFDDVSGLEKKGLVKIAGVKVGWIKDIQFLKDTACPCVTVVIEKKYNIKNSATAIIRQDSFLGGKYIDIIPGEKTLPNAPSGSMLNKKGIEQTSIDTILRSVQDITKQLELFSDAFAQEFSTPEKKAHLISIITNAGIIADKIASLSTAAESTFATHRTSFDTIISNMQDLSIELKKSTLFLTETIKKISLSIDKDITPLTAHIDQTAHSINTAAKKATEGLTHINFITEKINTGDGFLGKIVNDQEMYKDISVTTKGLKKYFNKVDSMGIVFDTYGEYLYKTPSQLDISDTKGYFNLRIHTNEDHFYILQYVLSQRGTIKRKIEEVRWYDENENEITPSQALNAQVSLPELIGKIEKKTQTLDKAKFGIQFGKLYRDIALRVGLIEGSAGVGLDINLPFSNDLFRWIMTFEAFDLSGRNRIKDDRPHIKWLNRLFLLRNIYLTFGADDCISKHSHSGFFGAGIRFCDDDVKYILSAIGAGTFN